MDIGGAVCRYLWRMGYSIVGDDGSSNNEWHATKEERRTKKEEKEKRIKMEYKRYIVGEMKQRCK